MFSGAPPGATLAPSSKRRDRRVRPLQHVVMRLAFYATDFQAIESRFCVAAHSRRYRLISV